ncbi:MAG: hypothetical protein ACT4OO_16495 [Nitrospiraceae bacterium]
MRRVALVTWMLLLWLSQTAGAASGSADSEKKEDSKGVTMEDLGRGLKSAAQNIEKEIPKIGPAIGETFKKITGKDSGTQKPDSPSKEKK